MALTSPPSAFEIEPSETFPKVFGVLMEFAIDEEIASLLAACDGTASLYLTSGGGVLGGIGHQPVRDAAQALVRIAQNYHSESLPTDQFPYPAPAKVRFYLLCFDGVRFVEGEQNVLEQGSGPYFDLFAAGHEVLTQLRLVEEAQPEP